MGTMSSPPGWCWGSNSGLHFRKSSVQSLNYVVDPKKQLFRSIGKKKLPRDRKCCAGLKPLVECKVRQQCPWKEDLKGKALRVLGEKGALGASVILGEGGVSKKEWLDFLGQGTRSELQGILLWSLSLLITRSTRNKPQGKQYFHVIVLLSCVELMFVY